MTVVAIAGSRDLPPGQAPRLLVRFLAALPADTVILLRRGLFTPPNLFEAQVEGVCDLIGLRVEWCQPGPIPARRNEPGETVLGRRAVWARDVDMIERAELVLTFVDSERVDDTESGTVNFTEKAIEHDKVVYAYALFTTFDGETHPTIEIQRVGENDPEGRWAELVPAG
jgi:hypothetical protein